MIYARIDDSYASFDGMSPAVVEAMLSNRTSDFEILSEAAFLARPIPQPDFSARVTAFEVKVEKRLNEAAAVKGYDSIYTAAIRAGYAGPFHDEGVAYATFMDATWAKCYEILGAVMAGQRAEPTWDELEAELPAAPY